MIARVIENVSLGLFKIAINLTVTQVGFNNDGKLKALQIKMYSNSGYSMDLSPVVS